MSSLEKSSISSSKTVSKHLKSKTSEFLACKDDSASLVDIIVNFKESLIRSNPISSHLLCLETIFLELLKSSAMLVPTVPLQSQELTPENNYKLWLKDRYDEVFELIVQCLGNEKTVESQQAFATAMKLLSVEGKNPIIDCTNGQTFPISRLHKILMKLLSSDKLTKPLITRLSEYMVYDDCCYYVWKIILKNLTPTKMNQPNNVFVQNYLELFNVIIRPPIDNIIENGNDEFTKYLCNKNVKVDDSYMRKNVNKSWNFMIQWEFNDITHRQLLVLLLEKVIQHLEKPMLLTDFLMDSLDVGGPISLLALQGIFILIQKFNMSYPNIYEKLYGMFEPELFCMKFKPRLFYLADIFLTSTYLPETLVAAFIKRFARLALVAPPQDIVTILYFIGNLIIRHPGLKRLIFHNQYGGTEISHDPYIMEEADPNKSRALESSLWEIQLLKNHVLPIISNASKSIISTPLPNVEWDLSNYLELKENDVFDQEISTRTKEYALTFERPLSVTQAREQNKVANDKLTKYFKLC